MIMRERLKLKKVEKPRSKYQEGYNEGIERALEIGDEYFKQGPDTLINKLRAALPDHRGANNRESGYRDALLSAMSMMRECRVATARKTWNEK